MRRTGRILAVLLAAAMLLPWAPAARADAVSLGIYFSGITEKEDGSQAVTKLEGSFRVSHNGQEIGTIRAGQGVLALDSGDRITIEPMPETMPLGWDLSTARASVTLEGSGNVTVPIIVYALRADDAQRPPAPTEIPTGAETEPAGEELSVPQPASVTVPESNYQPQATPELTLTAVPTAEPTPEPPTQALTAAGTGSIRIGVFNDKNTNGEHGPYDTELSQVTVYLMDGETDTAYDRKETDAAGEALFENLPEGSYRARIFLPEDWGFTRKGDGEGLNYSCTDITTEGFQDTPVIRLRAGEDAELGVGAGKMAHVSGYCWLDANGDGIRKSGEQMLPGIRITLKGQKNGLEYETFSGEDGSWMITRVKPGYYDITAYAPEGMMFTRYSKTGGKDRSIFTSEGVTKATRTIDTNKESKDNQNIGFMWTGSISGRCFLDANYNGLYDEGEEPMPGVKVTAIKQVKDEEAAVAYSGEDGTYTLTGLRGNTYKMRAVLPAGESDFTKVVGDPLGNHFKARPGRRENFWENFVLGDAEQKEMNVGVIYPGSASGTVYMDDDFSATLSGNEKPVSGFTVTLTDEKGTPLVTDKTNAKGVFTFTDLVPGTYMLRVTANPGYAFTKAGEGNVILNKSGGQGNSEPFRVELGEARTGLDIGMILPGTVKGTVFADRNDNGLKDDGEDGLEGTTVRLMSEEGEAFRAEIGSTGTFLFDAVMPGRYRVTYELPAGAILAQTAPQGSQITGENGRGASEWFDFKTGAEVTAPLCGGLTLGSVDGKAFADHDGDGRQGAGEEDMSGLTVTLRPGRKDLEEIRAETGADGKFSLKDLHPDTYTLEIATPEGTVVSRTDDLTLPLTAGKGSQEAELKVSMGGTWSGQQIGLVVPAGLSGQVWMDENNDGVRDETEATPAGVTVTVTDEKNGTVFDTLRTDADGRFATGGMIPGSFTVSLSLDENTLGASEGDSTFRQEGNRLVMTGIALEEGREQDDLLAGIVKYTTLGGRVWIDRGGSRESLAGASITLKDADGTTVNTATTGEDGQYRFTGLMPGTYIIEGNMPAGCVVVKPDDSRLSDQVRSIAEETDGRNGTSGEIMLEMGRDQTNLDIGCVLPGRLGDYCWLDLNGDGLQDWNEPGIPGVKIELIADGETVAETESDQYGLYRFEEIYPAVYTLLVTPPEEVRATVRRTDIRLIASVLLEEDGESVASAEVTVESDKANYNADLGFVLRQEGKLPAGVGEGETQDWTSLKGSEN